MSSVQGANDSVSTSRRGGIVNTVRSSALLILALIGLVEVIVGYVMHTGVWAAILAVWGSGLILVGLVGYAFVWWKRQ